MSSIAVIYWSMTGNTQAMAEAIAKGAREAGAQVLYMAAIMTYGFSVAQDNFEKAGVALTTLCDYDTLIAQAAAMHYVQPSDLELLARWRENPSQWKREDAAPEGEK